MHILHLTPYYAPAYAFGGVVRAVEGMAQSLVRREHQVTVLTTDVLDQQNRHTQGTVEFIDGVQVIRSPNLSTRLRGRFNLSTPNKMQARARSLLSDVDILHCHEFRTVENLVVTPVAAGLSVPMVLSPHGTLTHSTGRSRMKQAWDRLLSPVVARRFDEVIALTKAELEDVQALWGTFGRRRIPAQFSVIPNGIDSFKLPDASEFRQRYDLGGRTVILFMGRLHQRKGVDVLVQAFKQANVPDTRLMIVGPDEGMLETLREIQDERIIITGYLTGDERLAAYAAADVFALPATGEGLSMAVLEAMSAGLPVILSPGCNLPEAAEAGAGLIIEPQVDELVIALKNLLEDTEQRRQMGGAARQLIAKRFTWDIIAEQLEAVYQRHVSSSSE